MGSWKLGRIAGIDISLHWTLLLLVAWVAFSAPSGGAIGQVAFVAALFGCVLLHELGHALAARQFGIGTRGITLLPIGGVASLERMPRRPLQELWIAVAGPLVNVVIATGLFLILVPVGALAAAGIMSAQAVSWLQYLMWANISLVVFNMLPAFPMDGGRVLRSMLALRLPYLDATRLAAGIGKFVAMGMAALAVISGHWMLLLVAGFVAMAGSAEARMVAWEHQQAWGVPMGGSRAGRVAQDRWQAAQGLVVWDEVQQRYRVISSHA